MIHVNVREWIILIKDRRAHCTKPEWQSLGDEIRKVLGSTWFNARTLTFFFHLFVVCVCVACMYTCIRVYMQIIKLLSRVFLQIEARGWCLVSSSGFYLSFWYRLSQRDCWLVRLTSQHVPGILLSHPTPDPSIRVRDICHHAQLLHGCLGIQTDVLVLLFA